MARKDLAWDDARNAKRRADSGIGLVFAAAIVIVDDDYFVRRSRGRVPPVSIVELTTANRSLIERRWLVSRRTGS